MNSSLDRLKGLCNAMRVKTNRTFTWGISEKEGAWIQNNTVFSKTDWVLMKDQLMIYQYEVTDWKLEDGVLTIYLKNLGGA